MRYLRTVARALILPRHLDKQARVALTRSEAESSYLRDLI